MMEYIRKGQVATKMNIEAKAFRRIQWGLLFFIDYAPRGIDLLPDIVGLALVFSGVKELVSVSDRFLLAKRVCIPLIVLALYELVQPMVLGGVNPEVRAWIGVIRSIAETGLNITLVTFMCSGLRQYALSRDWGSIAHMARRRSLYFTVALACSFSMIGFALASPMVFSAMAAPMFLLYIIVVFMLMGLFGQAAKMVQKQK
ncbi:hypothetical protein ABE142_06465 [Paenibacillus alvei]|uniref:Uncharacterized protein n=3 Tax=Paenibacillus alvei TaxID=44250 RepID=A0AAP6ZWL0_PAEAL|nr:hypothetical protein [Paenibacillus alvei]MBG9733716.1 hypothetical protein [Paenibacillus alvei]MBG9745741.1 hypothetical protein [Paenibacillus alvei]MCY9583247.1 hypothetical protein [Paenibacillus alvei]NEZ41676.1 hypothetical protein [Paenibacillus alvei]NOJ69211.1 hypothetical protein [Paenibacillus alvei]